MSIKPYTEKNCNLFGSGSVIPEADPHQNETDPKHGYIYSLSD